MTKERPSALARQAARGALVFGAICAAAPFFTSPPEGLSEEAWRGLGFGILMAACWISEAIPLAATALIPLAAFPLSGLSPIDETAKSYAHPLIILFLGGFLLAAALERWNLHRRLALALLGAVGARPDRIIAAMMTATAFLSLWISNTATTMIMAPIGAAIASVPGRSVGFAPSLMLGVAFAATIGGMGSIIGTPPNALFAAYMADAHGVVIGFAEWMAVGLPAVLILLPATWWLLTRVLFSVGDTALSTPQIKLDPLSVAERRVAWICAAAAMGWVLRPYLDSLAPGLNISDAGIAMVAAIALFFCPDGANGRLLGAEAWAKLRWDVLILFGGGLALARVIDSTGLAAWLASQAASLEGAPELALIIGFAAVIILVGELASNTAIAAVFLPVAGATAVGLGQDPLSFTLPVALAASIGFMLPVATPPNAIVFANPAVTRANMLRAGAPLDFIGGTVALAVAYILGPIVLGA